VIELVSMQPDALLEIGGAHDWPEVTAHELAHAGPDLSLVVRNADDHQLRGRCSLWWTETPPLGDERLGVIGHFGACDAVAAKRLLQEACDELQKRACTLAVGPMDGNTWRRYRLVVDPGSEPPFFLEPTNPLVWAEWWRESGFSPLAEYFSALNDDLSRRDPRAADALGRLSQNGVTIRCIDPGDFDAELDRIYAIAEVAFRPNYLYTPLPRSAFVAQYQKVRALVIPELVLIAEHEGRPVGFSFSLPDALERLRGAPPRTVIVKTIASLPERTLLGGLGTLMTDRTHAAAHTMGFTRAIHALMHATNQSRRISERTAHVMRRYALFGRRLDQASVAS
jgi:hypothetical protein